MNENTAIISLAEALGRFRALSDEESDLLYQAIDRERRRLLRAEGVAARQTRPWTVKEIRALSVRIKRGGSINSIAFEVAEKLDRTPQAVRRRIYKLRKGSGAGAGGKRYGGGHG